MPLRGRGGVEPGPQHPQRHPVGIDRKRRVQVQAAGQRAGLVRANHPQPLCLAAPGEAQAGGVLHTQHRGLRAHALQRALAMGRKDVLDTDLAVGGLVDEPVMSLDQGTRSVGGAGDGAHRRLCHMAHTLDQARAQTCIAQRGAGELVRRPGVGVEPLAGRQRRQTWGGQCKALAPCRLQRIQIHRLARVCGAMGAVVAPAPAALTDPDPVRRAQARPRVLGLVDEGLQQPGPIAVEAFEVFAHRTHRPAQHVGGEVAAGNVGTNQHPAQPHHPVQVGASARIIPSDPGVAGVEPARRGREPHAAQPAVGGADEITQLMADKGTGAARMLVCHQGVPDQALRVGLDPHQRKVAQHADLARHIVCRRHRLGEHPGPAHRACGAPWRRQRDFACGLEVGQRLAAARALAPPAPIAQIERFTDTIGHLLEASDTLRRGCVEHVAQLGKIAPQAVSDLILNLHGGHGSEVAS